MARSAVMNHVQAPAKQFLRFLLGGAFLSTFFLAGWVAAHAPGPCHNRQKHSPYCDLTTTKTVKDMSIDAIAISADSKTLVTGGADKTIRTWDLATGQLEMSLKADSGRIIAIAVSPDGKTVVTGSGDRTVKIWSLVTGKRQATLKGHTDAVTSVAITPDQRTVVSGSIDGTIKVWDLATDRLRFTLPEHPPQNYSESWGPFTVDVKNELDPVESIAITPDSQTLIAAIADNNLKFWNLKIGKLEKTIPTHHWTSLEGTAMSSDGRVLLTNDYKQIKVWDRAAGASSISLSSYPTTAIAITPDNQSVVTGSGDEGVKVWHLASGALEAALQPQDGWISEVAVSPNGKYLVALNGVGTFTISQWQTSPLAQVKH
jgi:WD40 repeat protein